MLARWLVFHVASGQAFFSGAGCLILAAALPDPARVRWARIARNVLLLIGGTLVVVSAAPLALWAYVGLTLVVVAWLAVERTRGRLPGWSVRGARGAVVLAWAVAVAAEVPYHVRPQIPLMGRPTLGVIGDSVTAGISGYEAVTWPRLLAARHDLTVRDHSRMGANVGSALEQAGALADEERLVLLEIGGNDFLGLTTPEAFATGLEALLHAVCRPGRVVVMLELPLPPTFNAYGRSQRRLARRYGVLLVPKRVLMGCLIRPGATLDTVHLSREGHRAMADATWSVLGSAYGPQAKGVRGLSTGR